MWIHLSRASKIFHWKLKFVNFVLDYFVRLNIMFDISPKTLMYVLNVLNQNSLGDYFGTNMYDKYI